MNVNLSRSPTRESYGLAIPPSPWGPLGVISSPGQSCAGNIVFSVGHANPEGGWTKSEHVVLTPDEASAVIGQMLELLDPTPTNHSTEGGPAVCILPSGEVVTFGAVRVLVGAEAQLYVDETTTSEESECWDDEAGHHHGGAGCDAVEP